MSILHIRNIARVPRDLADAQRILGLKSDVFSYDPNPYDIGADFQIDVRNGIYSFKQLQVFRKVLKLSNNYDILHFHVTTVSAKGFDLLFWRMKKKVFIHHHGVELRNVGENPLFQTFSDGIFVSTPDLLRWSKDAVWIPNPINLGNLAFQGVRSKKEGEPIVIVHAPTNRIRKGTVHVEKAIDNIKKMRQNIEYICVENINHDKAIEIYKTADIIVDQVKVDIGSYGVFSIESMALGKPVICSINEGFIDKYFINLPIINVTPETLEEKILFLIDNEDARIGLAEKGRKYVESIHDQVAVARKVSTYYNKA